jgi:uncharacterized protein (DUF305 family)
MYPLRTLAAPARRLAIALLAAAATACGAATSGTTPPLIQPGAPGQASRVVTAEQAADQSKVLATEADVKFMQGMIHHHAQALDMTALLFTNSNGADMKMLAKRIDLSQADEIKFMRRWLEVRGHEVPGEHAHHMPGAPMMPGMLDAGEMARLADAKGAAFDRLFLEGMIKHHAGALTMVAELFATEGAGQEAEIFGFASDVDADQRMEIARMSAMLKELQK